MKTWMQTEKSQNSVVLFKTIYYLEYVQGCPKTAFASYSSIF